MLPMRIVVFLLVISTTFVTAFFGSSEEVGDKCCDRNCRCGFFEDCTDCNTCVKKWDYAKKYICRKNPCRSSCKQKNKICGNQNQCNNQNQLYPYPPYPPPYPPNPYPTPYPPYPYPTPPQDGPRYPQPWETNI